MSSFFLILGLFLVAFAVLGYFTEGKAYFARIKNLQKRRAKSSNSGIPPSEVQNEAICASIFVTMILVVAIVGLAMSIISLDCKVHFIS
ncbi:MAG: hypothetical protein PHE24_01945 [Patescibacteria group bacterium]|nr:hypothetical protein [Patescibacteria group bacterium]